jgi:hypothetical protein
MMTRQHYKVLAESVSTIEHPLVRGIAARTLGKALARDNPRFDLDTWLAACDVGPPISDTRGMMLPSEVTRAKVRRAKVKAALNTGVK